MPPNKYFVNDDGSDSSGVGLSAGAAYRTITYAIDDIRGAGHSDTANIIIELPSTYTMAETAGTPTSTEPSSSNDAITIQGPSFDDRCLIDCTGFGGLWDAVWRYMRFQYLSFDDTLNPSNYGIYTNDQGCTASGIDFAITTAHSYGIRFGNYSNITDLTITGRTFDSVSCQVGAGGSVTNYVCLATAGAGTCMSIGTGHQYYNCLFSKTGTCTGKIFGIGSGSSIDNCSFFGNATTDIYTATTPWAMQFTRNYMEGFLNTVPIDGSRWDGNFHDNYFYNCTKPIEDHSAVASSPNGRFEDPIELAASGVVDASGGDYRMSKTLIAAIEDGLPIGKPYIEKQLQQYNPIR